MIISDGLVLETAVVGYRFDMPGCKEARLSSHCVVERCSGNQEVDEAAAERIAGTPQRFELDGFVLLAAFDLTYRLLAGAETTGEVRRRHPQGVTDSLNPASVRPRLVDQWPDSIQALIELHAPGAGECLYRKLDRVSGR